MGPRAMLYPGYSKCGTCNRKHLYIAFTPSQIALLRELFGKHKEKVARKTLNCIEMSLEASRGDGNEGRFRCAHCDNEYIAIEMSDPELHYLKQIIDTMWCPCNIRGGACDSRNDPTDDGSRINDSTKHHLMGLLYISPFTDVNQIFRDYSIGEIHEALDHYPDVHIRVWED